ncbi:MAG: 4Fe-4S dicluster domain-containing protein [Candidatus Baldrarchaeia archaeon]
MLGRRLPKTEFDLEFRKKLEEHFHEARTINYCFQCGTCTGCCPSTKITGRYNPRLLIESALLGLTEDLLSSPDIWLCVACHTCIERCPQGVKVSEVLSIIRNFATRKNNVPEGVKAIASQFVETGFTIPAAAAILKRRQEMKLPELPKPNTEEIMKIFEATGFLKLVRG